MRTESHVLPLGTLMPELRLTDPGTGRIDTFEIPETAACIVIMVLCNHCPFVIHLAPFLGRLSRRYPPGGRVFLLGINGNDQESHPEDGPQFMTKMAQQYGWDFPYLYDSSQEALKALGAACTPDFSVYNANRQLTYRGQCDASRPARRGLDGTIPITGEDLDRAIRHTLAGTSVPLPHQPSLGCNVKWKPGQEPPWFSG